MTRNGHERTRARHNIDQQRQMAIVDVRTIKLDDVAHFLEQRATRRLNTKHAEHFNTVVRERARDVDAVHCKNVLEVRSVRFQDILLDRVPLASRRVKAPRKLVLLHNEHLGDARHTLQRNVGEHLLCKALQEHVFLALYLLVRVVVDNTNAQHKLLGVIFRVHYKHIAAKHGTDFRRNLSHRQVLVEHLRTVEHKTQQPWRLALEACLDLLVRNRKESVDKVAVLGNHRRARVGIVEHFNCSRDRLQRCVGQCRLDHLGRL